MRPSDVPTHLQRGSRLRVAPLPLLGRPGDGEVAQALARRPMGASITAPAAERSREREHGADFLVGQQSLWVGGPCTHQGRGPLSPAPLRNPSHQVHDLGGDSGRALSGVGDDAVHRRDVLVAEHVRTQMAEPLRPASTGSTTAATARGVQDLLGDAGDGVHRSREANLLGERKPLSGPVDRDAATWFAKTSSRPCCTSSGRLPLSGRSTEIIPSHLPVTS